MHWHCWHDDVSTRKKIRQKQGKNGCRERNPFVATDNYVEYSIESYCCLCGKRKTRVCLDYDVKRALQYPEQ